MQRRGVATSESTTASRPSSGAGAAETDRARLQAMFDAHHNLVWRTLRRFGLDAATAADVGQQAFLVAVERVADIWPGSERAFLVGTALRIARSQRRRSARLQLEAQLDERISRPSMAESHAITLELLDKILSQLDSQLVEVFVLSDVEGFSAPELARALGVPVGTVASRLRRARDEFRAIARRFEHVFAREQGAR